MVSRTPEGKHTKRFIVLKKGEFDTTYVRSTQITEAFPTRELAQAAVDSRGSQGVSYKIRQK